MKRLGLVVAGIIMMCTSANAQEKVTETATRTHNVMQGETVMLICKKYLLRPDDIYKLNPDAVHGISANMVLKLPATSKLAEERKVAEKIKKGAQVSTLSPK